MSTTPHSLAAPRALAAGARRRRAVAAEARWVRPALIALLVLTAVAYLWDLSASGDANSFYAAAVQAATKSWKAFFFGSLDSSSFITVDKPPASLWVMALSGRIFGFSSWSMLAPQALEGVAAVALLYGSVKRWFGPGAGLLAGAMLALTPVAALMFRFNNPDALLVALLVAGAYTLTRALEEARLRWMLATGALIGFAFLTKMGQALLVVPGFGIAYLVAAPTGLRRRIAGALAGLGALVVSCGWWIAIVALLPVSSRPFIDGSPDNDIFNLIFGYNGFSRLFGSSGPGGGTGGGSFSGSTGTLRLFNDLLGAQASWLAPAALLALAGGLWVTRRAPRSDRTRAALIVWGGWFAVTAAVFSYSQGIIHTYYTVALAPALAALVAIGGHLLWQRRGALVARALAAAVVALTAAWSYALLDRAPSWQPWLRPLVLSGAALAALGLLTAPRLGGRTRAVVAVATLAAATIAMLAGPAAYTIETIGTPHSGSTPSAGPTALTATADPGGRLGARPTGGGPGQLFGDGTNTGAGAPRGTATGGVPSGSSGSRGAAAGGPPSGFGGAAGGTRGAGGTPGGTASADGALVKALESDAKAYRWVAATEGSMTAASYELASGGEPVMAIGGFNGNGGDLSLAQFIRYVRAGGIHYFIASAGGGGGGPGGLGASTSSSIESWVASHYRSTTIGGVTVYDLSAAS
jgi:4-amino-4-deoxy-L-arabinose transferase-like glycosyltransferase